MKNFVQVLVRQLFYSKEDSSTSFPSIYTFSKSSAVAPISYFPLGKLMEVVATVANESAGNAFSISPHQVYSSLLVVLVKTGALFNTC
ncbi:MAG: hypothetical protein HYX40_09735 [Sphingobacteriales bacterium]|nr:hypothetical protein [Sphingobacteriales bacterium]